MTLPAIMQGRPFGAEQLAAVSGEMKLEEKRRFEIPSSLAGCPSAIRRQSSSSFFQFLAFLQSGGCDLVPGQSCSEIECHEHTTDSAQVPVLQKVFLT
jgi:hypothetical protein